MKTTSLARVRDLKALVTDNRIGFRGISTLLCFLLLPFAAVAQLPTPTYGWNLGNTMEAPGREGAWGPAATQELIDAVADAGFNTIRIPIAWDSHADQTTYEIDAAWLARVKEVVDWCYERNLTVLINSHWDGGWLERNITDTVDPIIDAKMQSYWTQIATAFAGYDNRLLFAGTNEPDADTAAEWATLLVYQQTFVNAVRATGGNNSDRWLVIQGPRTDINLSDELVTDLPSDSATGRLVFEVHFYPFQFTLMEQDEWWGKASYFWGQDYQHPTRTDRNASLAEAEAHVDAQFQKMADKFVSQGIPVVLGEFGAVLRTDYEDLTGEDYDLHVASRSYFHKYAVDSANAKGLKPIYWDNGWAGRNGFGLFDRNTNAIVDQAGITALTGGPALPPPGAVPTEISLEDWRFEHFGTTENTGTAADSADPDGDGYTNSHEYASGTDPNDAASYLSIELPALSGNDIVIRFPSVSGKTYQVERSDTLLGESWLPVQEDIAGTGGAIQVIDADGAAQEARFYRLVVAL